jgi:hypothetical protein
VKRKFAPQAGGDEGGAAQSAHNKSNPNLASAASRPARKEEEITEESFLQQREDADSLDNDDEVL